MSIVSLLWCFHLFLVNYLGIHKTYRKSVLGIKCMFTFVCRAKESCVLLNSVVSYGDYAGLMVNELTDE